MSQRPRENLGGVLAMLLAVAAFALMDASLKVLAPHYPPLEVAALRGAASWPLVTLWIASRGRLRGLMHVRFRMHLLRGALGVLMLATFAYALRLMPLANAYTIFFVAPLMIAALSVPLLGERVGPRRWIAIAAGLAGVLIVLRPSSSGLDGAAGVAMMLAAFAYACSAITVRVLGRTDSTESMVFWLTGMVALGAGLLAWPSWVPLRAEHYGVVVVIGLFGTLGQYAVTEAFRRAEASLIAPLEYTALVWALGIDWLWWGTSPDRNMLVGAVVIILSGMYLLRREKVHAEAEHP